MVTGPAAVDKAHCSACCLPLDPNDPGVSCQCERPVQVRLRVLPVSLAEANAYTSAIHRHNGPLPSAKFALGVATEDGSVVGVAIAGLPKARMLNDGCTLEVSRVCTDGTPNACSALYGACARVAKAMGYCRAVTYTLDAESGVSLRAAGWTRAAAVKGESWNRRQTSKGDPGYQDAHDTGDKWRWELNWDRQPIDLSWPVKPDDHPSLFACGESA